MATTRKSLTVEEAFALARAMQAEAENLAIHASAIKKAQADGKPDAYTYRAVSLPTLGVDMRLRIGEL